MKKNDFFYFLINHYCLAIATRLPVRGAGLGSSLSKQNPMRVTRKFSNNHWTSFFLSDFCFFLRRFPWWRESKCHCTSYSRCSCQSSSRIKQKNQQSIQEGGRFSSLVSSSAESWAEKRETCCQTSVSWCVSWWWSWAIVGWNSFLTKIFLIFKISNKILF